MDEVALANGDTLRPGDVIVVTTKDKGGWWVRRRPMMLRHPWQPWKWLANPKGLVNHVAMFVHNDSTGRPRGLEGRPSGFGWVNLEPYLAHPETIANTRQAGRTESERAAVVALATTMVGIAYDWEAILAFAAGAAGLPFLAGEWPEDGVPSQVVCSSALDYLYESAGWANPGGYEQTRGTDPTHWAEFIQQWLT